MSSKAGDWARQSGADGLKRLINTRLQEPVLRHLETVVATAAELYPGRGVYLVGGIVRDMVMDIPDADLDIVIESDAISLAEQTARSMGEGRLVRHPGFRTAKIILENGDKIDFTTARAESYPKPASLPKVRPADISSDLARRDFTINTLAVKLNPPKEYTLLDKFGGLADIDARVLRVLHPASFVDDPTRLYRAVRFSARLGFTLEPETARLFDSAVRDGYVEKLTGGRVLAELRLIFSETNTAGCAENFARSGLARATHPALDTDFVGVKPALDRGEKIAGIIRSTAGREGRPGMFFWKAQLLNFISGITPAETDSLCIRLGLGEMPKRHKHPGIPHNGFSAGQLENADSGGYKWLRDLLHRAGPIRERLIEAAKTPVADFERASAGMPLAAILHSASLVPKLATEDAARIISRLMESRGFYSRPGE